MNTDFLFNINSDELKKIVANGVSLSGEVRPSQLKKWRINNGLLSPVLAI